jgi:hypothetical protein
MSKRVLIKQTYWPGEDSGAQHEAKIARLNGVLINATFPVEVEVTRHQKKRTPEANAYLWAVCYALMSEASGYEREEIHYAMCCKHFGSTIGELMGEKFQRPVRTTTTNEHGELEWLGSGEFAEFVDFVIREALFWYDVVIPPPTPKEVPRP